MSSPNDPPKLHVDDDWKAQAQAEKQKLAEQEKAAKTPQPQAGGAKPAGPRGRPGQIPPADFPTLVSGITTQALFALGAVPDPQTGQRYVNLDLARHHVDSLSVLEEKTKGNLTEDEQKMLTQTLYELRGAYVQVSNASRSAATGGASD